MATIDDFYADSAKALKTPKPAGLRLNPTVADTGAAIGTIPEYLMGSVAKLYAGYVPGYTREERASAIDTANQMEAERFAELQRLLGGGRSSTPLSRGVTDVGRTTASLASGAAAFVPDLASSIASAIPVSTLGEKTTNILPPAVENYLRNITPAAFSQALALPEVKKPGLGERTVGDVFSKISGAAEKYIGEPAIEAGADPMIKELIGQTALAAIPAAGVRAFKAVKGKAGEVRPTEVKAEGEMVKVGEEIPVAAPEVKPAKVSPTAYASTLLHQQKALLQDKLAETTTAQGKRKLNKQIAEIDNSIRELIKQEQAPKYEGAVEELSKFYDDVLLAEAKSQTRKAWADKRANELAKEAGIEEAPISETLPGEAPQTMGVPERVPNYWEALKGEVPKETAPVNELPIDRLNKELKAKEAGYESHEAYLNDLKRQEALSGEGPYGSISYAPVTSSSITLKQVTGKKAPIQGPRMKGVSYEVNIDGQGVKSIAKINFDPGIMTPEKVAEFKAKYKVESPTLQNEMKLVQEEVKVPEADSRFAPQEVSLRDNLFDKTDSYEELRDSLKESLIESNPELAKPERLPELLKELERVPEYQKARLDMEQAQSLLDQHLGVKPGTPEAVIAEVVTKQPLAPESRTFSSVVEDVKTLAKDVISGERGEIGKREMSPEAKASLDRLKRDAERLGRNLSDHLKELKFPEETIKELTGKMPSAGGTRVKSTEDIKRVIDPDNLNADKSYVHTMKNGDKVVVDFTKVSVAKATEIYNTPNVGKSFITNPVYMFQKLGGPWKELYDNYNAARTQEVRNIKAVEAEIVKMRKDYSLEETKQAYVYAVAKRAGGVEWLQNSGIPVPEMVPKRVAELANSLEPKFKDYLDRLNEMRVKNGLKPVEGVKNYITFFSDIRKLGDKLGTDVWVAPDLMGVLKENLQDTSFKFAKSAGKAGKLDIDMDIVQAYHRYAKIAEHHINIQPIVSLGRTYLQDWKFDTRTGAPTTGFWSVEKTAPKAAAGIGEWLNAIGKGSKERLIVSMETAQRIGRAQQNLSGAYVGGNINTFLSQPSSLVLLPAAIGIQNVPRGLGILKPHNMEIAKNLSNVLDIRSFRSELANYAENIVERGKVDGTLKAIRDTVTTPMGLLDQATAAYVWWASYKTGLSRGLLKEKAAIFADDVTTKTQGSGDIGHVSKLQTSVEGSALMMLQTYKVAFGNFLYHEILKNPDKSVASVVNKSVVTFGSLAAINMIYNSLGLKAPTPEPEWKYAESREAGFSELESAGLASVDFLKQTLLGGGDRSGFQSPMLSFPAQLLATPATPEGVQSALINTGALATGIATGLPTMAAKRLLTKEGAARLVTLQPENREGKASPF